MMVRYVLAAALCAACAAPALAAPLSGTYTLGGDTVAGPGPGQFTLTATNTPSTFSSLRFILDNPTAFNQLTELSVNYNAVAGGIAGGSPRIAVVVDQDLNNNGISDDFFAILFGPPGSFVDPTLGAGSTGNLLALTDLGRYDLTGIGGSGYTDRATALAAVGNANVVRLSLILDTYDGVPDRTFIVDGISAAAADAPAPVPEPATLAVFGALGFVAFRVRRRRNAAV